MVKPSLPHHGPISAGTMAPIVPPSQSMVPVVSDVAAGVHKEKRLGRSDFSDADGGCSDATNQSGRWDHHLDFNVLISRPVRRSSASSRFNFRVGNISRLGASPGFCDGTVASAKTANPKIKVGQSTRSFRLRRAIVHEGQRDAYRSC